MNKVFAIFTFLLSSAIYATGAGVNNPPTTVSNVELNRYFGSWYEIVRIPNSFQDNTTKDRFGRCYDTIAEYAPIRKNKLSVKNTCIRYNETEDATMIDVAEAIGKSVENSGNAKLKVNFTGFALLRWTGFGDANYWILGLGPTNNEGLYSWAFVGSPDRKFGWILSRTKKINNSQMKIIKNLIIEKGYSLGSFINSRKT